MKIDNDRMNHPLHIIMDDGRIFGQFYNSWDKKYHLAEYIPYETLPNVYLCGKKGNFCGSRFNEPKRNKCRECWEKINAN